MSATTSPDYLFHPAHCLRRPARLAVLAAALLAAGAPALADVVVDWNIKANDIVVPVSQGPAPANRTMAMVQTAVFDATNAITRRYPAMGGSGLQGSQGASVDAAIAAANRGVLAQVLPGQQAAINAAYQAALAKIADGPAKAAGIAVGEQAAAAVLAARMNDGAATPETYRPHTTAGNYVPTVIPVAPQWPQRKPWLMSSSAQFRPGPPPALDSAIWVRDYNEIKAMGAKNSSTRTPEQTDIARFWEATMPPIYHGLARSVALAGTREVTQNARLFAAVAQAMDDANIAFLEAKYYYHFWRPITAIRNGDLGGNPATVRDPGWLPFIDTPMHPEYPCAHCTVSGAVGAILQAEMAGGPKVTLSTTSVTAKGATRSWNTVADMMQEVANARIYDGVHYRYSTEVGTAFGQKIGELAVARFQMGGK
jgi:hypothetical protein